MRRWLRLSVTVGVAGLVVGFLTAPAASAQQSVNFYMGGFEPTSADARGDISGGLSNDVLVSNLDFLSFSIKDFNGFTFGGEWLDWPARQLRRGPRRRVLSGNRAAVDHDFVNVNGTEIVQDLKLRIVPFTATVRCLPLGHDAASSRTSAAASASSAGATARAASSCDRRSHDLQRHLRRQRHCDRPVILGGVRVPIGPTAVGGEARYQSAKGKLPADQDFAGTKIDLGGLNYSSRSTSGSDARRARRPAPSHTRAVPVEKMRPLARTPARACRRLRLSPRSASSRRTAAGLRARRARCRRCLRAGSRGSRSPSRDVPACSGRAIPCSP